MPWAGGTWERNSTARPRSPGSSSSIHDPHSRSKAPIDALIAFCISGNLSPKISGREKYSKSVTGRPPTGTV